MDRETRRIELRGALWMTVGDKNLGGPGRVDLLTKIDECGSITQAAKKMKMSYKAAWDAIDAMNTLAGEPLVESLAGGKGGGGTRLTRRGTQLVSNFKLIEREHRHFVDRLSKQSERIADDLLLIERMRMRTSARNQFYGAITRIVPGAVNDLVELEVSAGQRISAVITRESTKRLELETGMQVFALIKATSIMLARDDEGVRYSAHNRLTGVVTRLTRGAVNDEVVIDLGDGGVITAIVSTEGSKAMSLKKGERITALFSASSVILGISD